MFKGEGETGVKAYMFAGFVVLSAEDCGMALWYVPADEDGADRAAEEIPCVGRVATREAWR